MECSQPNCIIVITILWVKICLLELWKLLFWCGYSIFGFSGIVFCVLLWCEYRMFCQALYCAVDGVSYYYLEDLLCSGAGVLVLATDCTELWCGHRYGCYRYCLLRWKLLLVSHWMLWRWYPVSFSGGFSISLLRNLLIGLFENTILKYKM